MEITFRCSSLTFRAYLERNKFFLFLYFSCEIELIPIKFLYDSYEIHVFQLPLKYCCHYPPSRSGGVALSLGGDTGGSTPPPQKATAPPTSPPSSSLEHAAKPADARTAVARLLLLLSLAFRPPALVLPWMVVILVSSGRDAVLATRGADPVARVADPVAGDADPVAKCGDSSPHGGAGVARLRRRRHLCGYARAPGCRALPTGC